MQVTGLARIGTFVLGADSQEIGRRLRMAGAVVIAFIAIAVVVGLYGWSNVRREIAERGENSEKSAQARQDELKRLVADAAGGGAQSVKAIADIRDILRPGNPEIDAISAEQLPKLVQRIIADLQKPAARPEDFAGAVKRALEQAQAQAGELKFVDAAKTLDEAIAKAEAEDQNRAKGRAALLAERGRVARLQLRYREAAGFYAKAAEATGFDPALSWGYALNAAGALYTQGDEFGDNAALSDSIRGCRSALNLVPRERFPLQWAMTQVGLGTALEALGERESGTATLQQAVSAFREALEESTRERAPHDWAMTQNNLGTALGRLAEHESGTATLQQAVSAFREALEENTRERAPQDWAMTQNNLGNALVRLGELESGTATLQQAVSAYRAALEVRTRERVPQDWATTQNNLGTALVRLGELESGTTTLQQAVSAYREALKEYTRERFPLYWATTQSNLGNALAALGERESGTEALQQAVSAYREALKERTRERVPLQWAKSLGNQGVAMMRLAERTKDAAMAKAAVEQISTAFETMRAGGSPFAAYYEAQLPEARAILQRLGDR